MLWIWSRHSLGVNIWKILVILCWYERSFQLSLSRFLKVLRLLKTDILPILLASASYLSLSYYFQEVGSSIGWDGISFQFFPARHKAGNRIKAQAQQLLSFVSIVEQSRMLKSSKWGFQLLSQIFSGCGTVFPDKFYIGLSTDIILLVSLGTGWGSTQHHLPLLPFNLWNQHLLQPFPVLFYGTLSGCQC